MPIVGTIEEIQEEAARWNPTAELRWYRPPHCDDNDRVLQQLWKRVTGETVWREIPYCVAD